MKRIGEDLSDEEINEMLSEADIDGDGCIEFHGNKTIVNPFGAHKSLAWSIRWLIIK